ncbi:MAG: hypothetical protein AB7V18_13305 [Pyrinomonadaceae bacterium]
MLDEDVLSSHCENYSGVLSTWEHTGDCDIRPVIAGLHEKVAKALSRMFHEMQGIHRMIAVRSSEYSSSSRIVCRHLVTNIARAVFFFAIVRTKRGL